MVLGEDEDIVDTATSANSKAERKLVNGLELEGKGSPTIHSIDDTEISSKLEKVELIDNLSLFQQQPPGAGSGGQLFDYKNPFDECFSDHVESAGEAHISTDLQTEREAHQVEPVVTPADFVHELFPAEGHMINPITGEEVAGVEPDGTIKAMEKMLKEGVVGEAGPMFKDEHDQKEPEPQAKESDTQLEFNDVNYWRRDYSQSVEE